MILTTLVSETEIEKVNCYKAGIDLNSMNVSNLAWIEVNFLKFYKSLASLEQ